MIAVRLEVSTLLSSLTAGIIAGRGALEDFKCSCKCGTVSYVFSTDKSMEGGLTNVAQCSSWTVSSPRRLRRDAD